VHDLIYDMFETKFVAAMEALKVGDPMHAETDIGPIATKSGLEDLLSQIETAKSVGGKVLTGGERIERDGNFFKPAIIVNIPPESAIAREEMFGPIAMLFRVGSLEEAIRIANSTPFGLGASAWTRDLNEQQRLTSELECGQVFFNAMVASDPRLPFGGVKHSGYGRELSAAGMREFLNAKTVVVAGVPRPQQTSLFAESATEYVEQGASIYGLSRRSE